MKYFLVIGLFSLVTACSKSETGKESQISYATVESSAPVVIKSAAPEPDYNDKWKKEADRFSKEITQTGDCWASEYTPELKASFLKTGPVKGLAHILMAKDNGVVLFGQPEPDCQESFTKSAKCTYWIRTITESEMSTFFNKYDKKVTCPVGLTVKSLVDKANSSDKETIDFSKVSLK